MTRIVFASLLASVLLLPACGDDGDDHGGHADGGVDCSQVAGVDTFSAGLSKAGANGYTFELTEATPAPPAKGNNTWTVTITDAASAAAAGKVINVDTWMPHHQHGSPIEAEATETADGVYELTPVNLFMPGVWEVTVEAKPDADSAAEDSALFTFCIEG